MAVERGDKPSTRGPLLRTLLALLAITPGAVVPSRALMDELWGEDLPEDPRRALAILVNRLRSGLLPESPRDAPVHHEYGGYRLDIDPRSVDLVRFDAAADAALADPEPAKALVKEDTRLGHAHTALQEWRGAPFEGCVVAGRLQAEQVRIQSRYLSLVALATLRPVAVDPLAAALATSSTTLLDDVRPALDTGLLVEAGTDRIDFRHDLVAGVVQDVVPAALGARDMRAEWQQSRTTVVFDMHPAVLTLLDESTLGDMRMRSPAGHQRPRPGRGGSSEGHPGWPLDDLSTASVR